MPAPKVIGFPELNDATRIFLVGMPASGKSILGRHLAQYLNWKFTDTDSEIEMRCGVSISWIFEKEGEAGFRKHEQNTLLKQGNQKNMVIATGGGIVLSAENRAFMRQNGCVIYLNVPLKVLLERVNKNNKRPLLTQNQEEKLRALHNIRAPLYAEVQHQTFFNTGNLHPKKVAETIANKLVLHHASKCSA